MRRTAPSAEQSRKKQKTIARQMLPELSVEIWTHVWRMIGSDQVCRWRPVCKLWKAAIEAAIQRAVARSDDYCAAQLIDCPRYGPEASRIDVCISSAFGLGAFYIVRRRLAADVPREWRSAATSAAIFGEETALRWISKQPGRRFVRWFDVAISATCVGDLPCAQFAFAQLPQRQKKFDELVKRSRMFFLQSVQARDERVRFLVDLATRLFDREARPDTMLARMLVECFAWFDQADRDRSFHDEL